MIDWDKDFFHCRLQKILKVRFKTHVEIFRNDTDAAPDKPYIANRLLTTGGDAYSGETDFSEVELVNFIRPDNGEKLIIKLLYAFHTLSGQMDDWSVVADGLLEQDLDSFNWVFQIDGYRCFHQGNNMTTEYVINRKKS